MPRKQIDLSVLPVSGELQRRRTTPDYIADVLREAIYEGVLPDGEVLNQVAVAEHFGVSRVPVREAMRQLSTEGLIDAEAHRRPVVRGLTLERVLEIFDLRSMIEGYLVEKATGKIEETDLARLGELIEQMRTEDDHLAWIALNRHFHQVLYAPSNLPTTLQLSGQLRGRAERYLRLWSAGRGVHRNEEANREHERIVQYVREGDAAAARREVEQHVLHTRDEIIRMHRRHGSHRTPAT